LSRKERRTHGYLKGEKRNSKKKVQGGGNLFLHPTTKCSRVAIQQIQYRRAALGANYFEPIMGEKESTSTRRGRQPE